MIIRAAEPADAAGIASVHVRSWQHAYRGLLPQDVLDALSVQRRTAGWERILGEDDPPRGATAVAEDGGAIVGFVNWRPSRDPETDPLLVGELVSIYVLPDRFGSGFGRALMSVALVGLAGSGYTGATLWVLAGNDRAIGFYEAAGWAADGTSKDEEIAGSPVTELRYRRALP